MSLARAIGRNAGFTAIGRIVTLIVWIAMTPRILAALGPERFGLWSILLAVSGSLATIDLGLGVAVSRFAAELAGHRRLPEIRRLVGKAFAVQAGLTVLLVVPALAMRDPILERFRVPTAWMDEARPAFLYAMLAFGVGMVANLLTGALQGVQRMELAAAISLPAAVALLAGILAATRAPEPLVALFLVQLAYNGLMVIGMALALLSVTRRAPGILGAVVQAAPVDLSLRRVLGLSSWLQLTSLFALAQNNLDKFLLGALVSLARVGDYEIAWRASYFAYLLPIFFLSALLPAAAAREATHGLEARLALYRRALEPYLWCVLGLTGLLIALAPSLLEAWIGHAPPGAVFMLRCVAIAQAASLGTGIASTAARAGDRAGLESAYVGMAVLLHLGLSYAGWRAWGWPGIPIGFAAAAVLSAVWFVARVDRWLGVVPLAESLRTALPAFGVSAVAGLAATAVAAAPFGVAPGRAHGLIALIAAGGAYVLVGWIVVVTLFPWQGRALEDRVRSLTRA